jgi:starch synthase
MKILFIASEAAPLAKVGGLADVTGALPKSLISLGHDVRIIMPQYSNISARFHLKSEIQGLDIDFPASPHQINLNLTMSGAVPVYTLESAAYFGTPEIYVNDLERFYFFSRAVFAILPRLSWQPEIIHCHDWMTALIIMWAKKAGYPYRSLFTIHNLNFQGNFEEHPAIGLELKKDWEFCPAGAPEPPACFMGPAIVWADQINTVSETYAREIATPEYGVGLDNLLRYRHENLCGIMNGIDTEVWNPRTDPYLETHFDSGSLSLKSANKTSLQQISGLTIDPNIPLIGMVQRLDEQKGLDIFMDGIDNFLSQNPVQLVIQGRGRGDYQDRLSQIAARHPRQIAAVIAFEELLAHRVYAACDLFLMPSRFEPCGLGQMIAMRYGAIPVVRHTGGLVDSVPEFSDDLTSGHGFVFHDYSAAALFATLKQALDTYYNRKLWLPARERVSRIDFSWQASALKYESLYHSLIKAWPLGPGL